MAMCITARVPTAYSSILVTGEQPRLSVIKPPPSPWRRQAPPSGSRAIPPPPSALTGGGPTATGAQPLRVCVVGGGVAGLTTALRLLQINRGYRPNPNPPTAPADAAVAAAPKQPLRPVEVTVLASGFGSETTTAGAAGLWGPYKLSDTPEPLISRWGAETYEHLMALAHSGHADVAGVSLLAVNSLYPEPQEPPFWRHIPTHFQIMDRRALEGVTRQPAFGSGSGSGSGPGSGSGSGQRSEGIWVAGSEDLAGAYPDPDPDPFPVGWGYHWNSLVCEGSRYLPWLERQIQALGGRLLRVPRLTSLEQIDDVLPLAADTHHHHPDTHTGAGGGGGGGGGGDAVSSVDLVVNAAGLGCLDLLPDPRVAPIRGQVVRVEAPWVKEAYFFEPFYIIPNRDTVVLGGTGQVGNFSTAVCPHDRAAILEGCARLLPSLRGARVVADWVGLRPGRTRLRLELEREGVELEAAAGGGGGGGGGGDGPMGRLRRRRRAVPVVHNYGHGGAGLTLGWGCAGDVVRLVLEAGLLAAA
ncbi:hypothetical protein PLESTF_000956400 [Pleodorina starrii]|nr:hypothetical protein PLESTM_001885300 [Pleodorina starrii]GLC70297.1 hypothetical protein PLESTF_000956400 [Pleodorina starrii]